MHLSRPPSARLALTLALSLAQHALAQTAPDAGQTLQQIQPPVLQTPRLEQGIDMQASSASAAQPGGASVLINSLLFAGNTQFTAAELHDVLGKESGKTYDLAGLQDLAERISQHYRSKGYPFARAFLSAQPIAEGVLRIDVVEGQYDQIIVTGDADLAAQAQGFLSALHPGDVIQSTPLERASLILSDQPGIIASPLIRPGGKEGTGDLEINLKRSALVAGDAALDNQGSHYTGKHRVRANLYINSPFLLGDQMTLRTLVSELGMWSANLDYSVPLGTSGLRAQAGYAHTYYELGNEFATLKASGTAQVSTVGLKYPLVRSQQSNLSLNATWQGKDLNDKQDTAGTHSNKSSQTLPLALSFDHRDNLAGGGISYGTISHTSGELQLESALRATDASTAQSQGAFSKMNLDIARIQSLQPALSLFGRVSAQWADKNLDSSEKFGLGGSSGVRAYPGGEGFGDRGWLVQLEMRYSTGDYAPYVFIDSGDVSTNTKPWDAAANQRALSGAGLGLRYQHAGWSLDASAAWRSEGGKPLTETSASDPMVWLNLAYKF